MTRRGYDEALTLMLQSYALCVPLLYVRAGFGAIAFVDLAMPLALIFALMRIGALPPIFLLYLGYIGTAFLSLLLTETQSVTAGNWLLATRLLAISLPFWLIFCLTDFGPERRARLLRTILVGLTAAVFAGIVLHLMGIEIRDTQQRLWGVRFDPFSAAARAGGVVGNSTEFGTTAAMFGMVVLASRAFGVNLGGVARAALLAMTAAALVFASSRVGLLMTVVFFATFAVLQARLVFREAVVAILAPTLGVLALIAFGDDRQLLFLETSLTRLDVLNVTGQGEFFESVRTEVWQMLLSIIFEVPLFGHGFKASYSVFDAYIDNAYLQAWFEVGPAGALMFAGFWLALLVSMFVTAINGRSAAATAGFAITVALMLGLTVTGPQSSWSTMPVLFMLLAMSLRAGVEAMAARSSALRDRHLAAIASA